MPHSRANGVDIWYEISGDGPALILIHANPFDHDLWLYQRAHFSTWVKVGGIEILGYRRAVNSTTALTPKSICEHVIRTMDDRAHERPICIGWRLGWRCTLDAGPR